MKSKCKFGRLPLALTVALGAALLTACTTAPSGPLGAPAPPRDDSIKTAFRPDASTTVVAVQAIKKGESIVVPDAGAPVIIAADLCLVKLVVGPGNLGPAEAPSTTTGIGIEVWLPTAANWNQRIRNYGGGGWVGGGHKDPTKVGSKFPAPVIAGMGYASGTTDAGQSAYQDGSFVLQPGGKINTVSMADFTYRAIARVMRD